MNPTVLLTGASSGIGRELAITFAKNGHPLVLIARTELPLRQLATELNQKYGVPVEVFSCDLSTPEAASKVYDFCNDNGLQIDILVNNAGVGDYGLFYEMDLEKQCRMIQLNVMTLTSLTHLFLPAMLVRQRGYVLQVASIASVLPGPWMAVYYATKAYVLHFSEAIANELKGTGVSITCLCPGGTATNFFQEANAGKSAFLKNANLMPAAVVAEFGYKALMSRKTVAIPGWVNYCMVNSVRFFPRNIVTRVSQQLSRPVQ
ncbi:MAG: SDR family oxidoreductase [Cytophagaceae bacterium]|jgi:hypothetical protein|nr:SDR family oxidoreductase [Cytophagaceae bacterium]